MVVTIVLIAEKLAGRTVLDSAIAENGDGLNCPVLSQSLERFRHGLGFNQAALVEAAALVHKRNFESA